ncbi:MULTISPECIES: hypothetical protein [Clostridium]|uniref:Uncharacterized protein n=3 Tax=Clostridium TaxID=1485 RepID=A0A7Y3WU21_9CLOT|nr:MULTISPECIES: hypothetical protein [Clostridium]MBU3101698.1 hypothetical protein [Clostridium sp. DSM 17811]MBW9151446.1 hypothetical protein [Clostridium estertheticum]NNU77580.1 hypothetical protein [Clostridium estertheticum]WBL48476.1 hypothetical protein LOR37_07415 [Clostridium estertheticum]WLC83415.1 hypothetical protein KTC97_15140 [Clostridium estertheticum]
MSLENVIEHIFQDIIIEMELPTNSLYIHSNKGKGKETSKSLCISKPEYPQIPHSNNTQTKSAIILNISVNNNIELIIKNKQFKEITVPSDAIIRGVNSDKEFTHVVFDKESEILHNYIKAHTIYCINNYEFSDTFGCCSKYNECSDAKRCLHENKLYAKGCYYRKNLESGQIFYGLKKAERCEI